MRAFHRLCRSTRRGAKQRTAKGHYARTHSLFIVFGDYIARNLHIKKLAINLGAESNDVNCGTLGNF